MATSGTYRRTWRAPPFAALDEFSQIGIGEPHARPLLAAAHVDVRQLAIAHVLGQLLRSDFQQIGRLAASEKIHCHHEGTASTTLPTAGAAAAEMTLMAALRLSNFP